MSKKEKSIKTVKAAQKLYKRPNINLLVPLVVLLIALFLAIFQAQQTQNTRGRAEVAPTVIPVIDIPVGSPSAGL